MSCFSDGCWVWSSKEIPEPTGFGQYWLTIEGLAGPWLSLLQQNKHTKEDWNLQLSHLPLPSLVFDLKGLWPNTAPLVFLEVGNLFNQTATPTCSPLKSLLIIVYCSDETPLASGKTILRPCTTYLCFLARCMDGRRAPRTGRNRKGCSENTERSEHAEDSERTSNTPASRAAKQRAWA